MTELDLCPEDAEFVIWLNGAAVAPNVELCDADDWYLALALLLAERAPA